MIPKFIINEPKEINHFFSVSVNVWGIKIRTINHLIYHLSHIMFSSSLIWDPLTHFLTNTYWIMHRVNLGIYRGICVNVITSSSMSNYSPSLTIFNLFFLKKFIRRGDKNFTLFNRLDGWVYLSYLLLVINNQFISTHILHRLISGKAFINN